MRSRPMLSCRQPHFDSMSPSQVADGRRRAAVDVDRRPFIRPSPATDRHEADTSQRLSWRRRPSVTPPSASIADEQYGDAWRKRRKCSTSRHARMPSSKIIGFQHNISLICFRRNHISQMSSACSWRVLHNQQSRHRPSYARTANEKCDIIAYATIAILASSARQWRASAVSCK